MLKERNDFAGGKVVAAWGVAFAGETTADFGTYVNKHRRRSEDHRQRKSVMGLFPITPRFPVPEMLSTLGEVQVEIGYSTASVMQGRQ